MATRLAHPCTAYKQIATQTAPPGALVLMLFDGALGSLERALPAFTLEDPREKNESIHNNLQRAVDIIRELNNSLDLEAGGELATTLRGLYLYFENRLVGSNLQKRRDGVDEVISHLREIRDAWAEMLASGRQEPLQMVAV